MRIEAYTQVQQLYSTKKTAKAAKTNKVNRADAVEISNVGKDFQAVKKAVSESADIREELTAPIKAKINSGTYIFACLCFLTGIPPLSKTTILLFVKSTVTLIFVSPILSLRRYSSQELEMISSNNLYKAGI